MDHAADHTQIDEDTAFGHAVRAGFLVGVPTMIGLTMIVAVRLRAPLVGAVHEKAPVVVSIVAPAGGFSKL